MYGYFNKITLIKQILIINYCKIEALDFYLNELSKRGKEYKENLEISLNTMLTQINDVYKKHKYTSFLHLNGLKVLMKFLKK